MGNIASNIENWKWKFSSCFDALDQVGEWRKKGNSYDGCMLWAAG